ncbi:hypothetical protein CspeluHIS016_0209100 [Cutaneotrichosporon spelunceum]|uniref:Uncharacterized protein n=1 Tax=Cutaneotrichosporon spelunceum TaxID=1672016 RepID=A0AAD3YBJ6_9TREE|nr:hypothetical protein CspeluHIS016_0209100 [Cutaneotrichosporon spelunceum]
MPKDKANKKKDKDEGAGPSFPPLPLPPGDETHRSPTWIYNPPPFVDPTAPPHFAGLRETTHGTSTQDKVGPWIQAQVDSHPRYESPETPTAIPSRAHSPAVTVLPQESISVIGVGSGSRAVTNSPATHANPRSAAASRRVFSRSANQEPTSKPHLHQPKPEHPFNYAKAQDARDRDARLMAERAESEAEQRRIDIIAAREAAEDAEELARLTHQRQSEEMAYRDLQMTYGSEDSAARREIDHAFAVQNEKRQAEIDEVRERQNAYDAAFARLHAPLSARNTKDEHELKWGHVFSAADMRSRDVRDTFSTESFGHKYHANGKPIPAPRVPSLPKPKPKSATVINVRAVGVEAIPEGSTVRRRINVQEAKVTKRSSAPKHKEKHCQAHTRSPAELLETTDLTRNLTLVKTLDTHDHFDHESDSEADAVSQITRLTNIARLVDESPFHDDTLCQLLDAARLNLIGDQAKKVLMRAARTRVDELSRELLEAASRDSNTPPLVIRKQQKKKPSQSPPGMTDVPVLVAPMTSAARGIPLPSLATPVGATAALSAFPLGTQPTPDVSPNASKNDQVITELLSRMTTLMEAFEAQKNNHDIGMTGALRGAFPGNGGGSFTPSQSFPIQSPPLVSPNMLPHGTFQFRGPDYQSPSGSYPKFEEQPALGSTSREFSTSRAVGPNGYIPTGGFADEYMMGGGSVTSSPKPVPTGGDLSSVPVLQAPTGAAGVSSQTSQVSKEPIDVSGPPTQALSQAASSGRTPPGPIINIVSPTTVNSDSQPQSMPNVSSPSTPEQHSPSTRAASVPSPATPETSRSPRSQTHAPVVVLERDLPPLPESVASYLTSTTKQTSVKSPTTVTGSRVASRAVSGISNATTGPDYDSAGYSSVVTRIVVRDGLSPALEKGRPWDIIVGRLHAMAAVWQEDSFVRALSSISLKRELDIVPLTIYTMNIYKSYLRNRLAALKPLPFDKLLVSPVHAETINSYIFAKKHNEAAALLVSLWAPLNKEPPRIIIAMTKHGYQEGWLAHRWDLSAGHLTSHHCVHVESRIDPYDKRPFNWWHAIRAAFPERGVLEPRHLLERNVRHVYTATPSDNSLRAALVTRNLLNGNKGDVDHGLSNLRDTMWRMTQQLLKKKQAGELLSWPDAA